MRITNVVQFFDFVNNLGSMFENFQNQRSFGFGLFKKTESRKFHFWVFEIFIKELVV
jgi:hypothetical protein